MSTANAGGGIADLSYKSYSGPLQPPGKRWWVIAKTMTKAAFKKRAYWVFTVLASWYYLVLVAIVYFLSQVLAGTSADPRTAAGVEEMLKRIAWPDQVLNGFVAGQLLWLSLAILLGSGAIANDKRTNALLLYLSRPCTKADYLKGKWMGIFLPLTIAMAIPTLVFLLYGTLNIREQGFFKEGGWFILRALVLIPLAGALHTSLIVGVSSLFDSGRIAGGVYAGIYFLTSFFTKMMWVVMGIDDSPQAVRNFAEGATFFGIDGQILALAKNVMGSNGTFMFGFQSDMPVPARPPWLMTVVVFVLLVWISLQIAWSKIRAVEAIS